MGQIFNPPKEVVFPKWEENMSADQYREKTEAAIKNLQAWAKQNGKGSEAGEIVSFSVADGSAQYVVYSLRPVRLIHVPAYDGYEQPYAHRLTASDIRQKIEQSKLLQKILTRK
jgi:hypothetical protein